MNPEIEDGRASINVPSNMVGLVIGKQGANLKQIETTFDVKLDIGAEIGKLQYFYIPKLINI
jgi:transcription antitermination factor NusA-like protein